MKTRKSARWIRLKQLASAAEQQAALSLQSENRNVQLQLNRLRQLTDYSLEDVLGNSSVSALKFLRYRQFAEKLGEAVNLQERTVQGARRSAAHARRSWLESRSGVTRYQTLADEAKTKERFADEAAERRRVDSDNLARFSVSRRLIQTRR